MKTVMKTAKTAYQKIMDAHVMDILPGGAMILRVDKVLLHEITTPNHILAAQNSGCDVVFNPNRIKAMIDHVSPAKDTATAIQGQIMRKWCNEHGIQFWDVGRNGICHALIPEKALLLPGEIGVMGDSHTCTHGALGAFAAGVGTTELGGAIMSGLWVCPPQRVIRINFVGNLPPNVYSKDLILEVLRRLGANGATNAILEFGGPIIEFLSVDARLTICNMSVEAGATTGMTAADHITISYLWPAIKEDFNSFEDAMQAFQSWNSDPGCRYDRELEIDVSRLTPLTTQNESPADVVPVKTLEGTQIDQVFLGSCTNGRLEDLRIAARVFKHVNAPVNKNTRCIVVPATPRIWRQANAEGLLEIFMEAGCVVTNPSCAACLGMSCGVLAPGERCASTSNRNFKGRMGEGGIVHLVSPATAVVSAIEGCLIEPDSALMAGVNKRIVQTPLLAEFDFWPPRGNKVINYAELADKLAGSASDFSGQVFYLMDLDDKPMVGVNTDQLIPAKYLSMTDKREMGKHCLEEIVPAEKRPILSMARVLVAGDNFGCGSSREHAVWTLAALPAGIRCVIAPGFARIFRRNMFNNGMLCITLSPKEMAEFLEDQLTPVSIDWEKGEIRKGSEIFHFSLADDEKDLIRNGGGMGVILRMAANLQR